MSGRVILAAMMATFLAACSTLPPCPTVFDPPEKPRVVGPCRGPSVVPDWPVLR